MKTKLVTTEHTRRIPENFMLLWIKNQGQVYLAANRININ